MSSDIYKRIVNYLRLMHDALNALVQAGGGGGGTIGGATEITALAIANNTNDMPVGYVYYNYGGSTGWLPVTGVRNTAGVVTYYDATGVIVSPTPTDASNFRLDDPAIIQNISRVSTTISRAASSRQTFRVDCNLTTGLEVIISYDIIGTGVGGFGTGVGISEQSIGTPMLIPNYLTYLTQPEHIKAVIDEAYAKCLYRVIYETGADIEYTYYLYCKEKYNGESVNPQAVDIMRVRKEPTVGNIVGNNYFQSAYEWAALAGESSSGKFQFALDENLIDFYNYV